MRPLNAEEKALWAKVIASVRPIRHHVAVAEPVPSPPPVVVEAPPKKAAAPAKARAVPVQPVAAKPGVTLDGSWDKRLSRGVVQPDLTVDLHGHNLSTAYSLLDHKLDQAIAMGVRVLLLITGKPPSSPDRPVARGAIRAAVGDWLAASRHAGSIAAVRGAHPRHGGSGALYIVLRRRR